MFTRANVSGNLLAIERLILVALLKGHRLAVDVDCDTVHVIVQTLDKVAK